MIRAMKEKDIPKVASLAERIMPFAWSLVVFRSCLKPNYKSFVLEEEGKLIEFIILLLTPPELHLMNIGVDYAFQRKGFAKQLLIDSISVGAQHAASNNVAAGKKNHTPLEVLLEVRQSNKAAITFYESAGFLRRGIRKNYYKSKQGREDAVLMGLPVNA
jgi:ribosomal-protein-alanine N-acetyltransferase